MLTPIYAVTCFVCMDFHIFANIFLMQYSVFDMNLKSKKCQGSLMLIQLTSCNDFHICVYPCCNGKILDRMFISVLCHDKLM